MALHCSFGFLLRVKVGSESIKLFFPKQTIQSTESIAQVYLLILLAIMAKTVKSNVRRLLFTMINKFSEVKSKMEDKLVEGVGSNHGVQMK